MDTFVSICLGIGLAAACGFRVFVPLLVLSGTALFGQINLSTFDWIGTWPAFIAFAAATLLEIGGYYIPYVDHLLDVIATPVAVVAGVIVSAAVFVDVEPWMKWTLAVIAGGGIAGVIQASTVSTRAASTGTTGGAGNSLFATLEWVAAVALAVLAVAAPVLVIVLLVGITVLVVRRLQKRRQQRHSQQPPREQRLAA